MHAYARICTHICMYRYVGMFMCTYVHVETGFQEGHAPH